MKYLNIYKDLIVRESLELATNKNIDVIGIIEGRETSLTFTPNYFSKTKKGTEVQLWQWEIINEYIPINEYFKISRVLEQADSKISRGYYREIIITIADTFDATLDFLFHIDPTDILSYTEFQNFINKIIKKIEFSESIRMYELLITCNEKNTKIEKLEKECIQLEQQNIELTKRIKE